MIPELRYSSLPKVGLVQELLPYFSSQILLVLDIKEPSETKVVSNGPATKIDLARNCNFLPAFCNRRYHVRLAQIFD